MQRQHTRLRCCVVHKAATAEVTRHTCNADNVAFLRIQHCGEELLDRDPVAEEIDTEKLLEEFFRCVEDGMSRCDACIVDQDRGRADVPANGCGSLGDGRRGCDVAFIVADGIV